MIPEKMTAPPVDIRNVDEFLRAVGQWNLYDMEVRRVRYDASRVGTGTLELSLYLGTDYIRRRPPGATPTEYEFVFQFDRTESLFIDDFAGAIIGEHEFASATTPSGASIISVSLTSVCGGDIRFVCSSISVVSVRELPDHAT